MALQQGAQKMATPRRNRALPALPQEEGEMKERRQPRQQQRRRRQGAQGKQGMCSCCSARSASSSPLPPPPAHEELLDTPSAEAQSARAGSPADSPPDSPRRQAAPASSPVAMRQLPTPATPAGEPIIPEAVHYLGSPTPSPRVLPQPRGRARAAPLPFRPPRQQEKGTAQSVANHNLEQITSWAPLPFRIETQPGESRNEAIVRVMDQQLPGPATATRGAGGAWDGPLAFGTLTTVVDKYVYNHPWDRVMAAYHWRTHADLEGDLKATQLPLHAADAQEKHTIAYDFSIDMPKVVKLVARCDAYRWVERQGIEVAARSFRSYSSTQMWRDSFHSLEFIEFFAVSDTETYMRKGLIADTSGGYPPKWVCNWIAKAYSQRSNDSCYVIDRIAHTIGERQPGEQHARSEHPDVVRIRAHLRMPPLSKPVKNARPLWAATRGRP